MKVVQKVRANTRVKDMFRFNIAVPVLRTCDGRGCHGESVGFAL